MKGIIAATYAPMHTNGLLNTDVIVEYGRYLMSNGVSGAFVNGFHWGLCFFKYFGTNEID